MRILLVEDDEPIAQALAVTLREQNYVVDLATDGQVGQELVEAFAYDAILLDVMLPKLDGISLCRKLRNSGYQMPILLVTAKDSSEDKVKGLDAGADDYVVKPFDLPELTARIRALLRRGNVSLPPVLEWGPLQLNPSNCEVTYDSKPVTLTPTEYRLLDLFMRNSSRVYSRSAILDHLWSFEEPPAEETIRAHIKGLRQKLKNAGAPADAIETVYGLGYRLKPIPRREKKPEQPRILMAGLTEELGSWLQQRLGNVSVCVTHSGEETLKELSDRHWSLSILDDRLREPSAVEVLRQASSKGQAGRSLPPLIYCLRPGVESDRAQSGRKPKKKSRGDDLGEGKGLSVATFKGASFLHHPIDPEELARLAAKLLNLTLPQTPVPEKQQQTLAAVAKVWERFKDRIVERISTIERATRALERGELTPELHVQAEREAHKLAGSLGTFGFAKGSDIAKQVEQLFQVAPIDVTHVEHLSELVQALRHQIEQNQQHGDSLTPAVASPSDSATLEDKPLLLVVDEDLEQPSPLAFEAQQWGMEAIETHTISAAREAIASRNPDAVLLDLCLKTALSTEKASKQHGLTFLAELTTHFPSLPVLVFTHLSTVEDRLEVARLGGRAFLQKPVRPAQVMETVCHILQRIENTEAKVMVVDDDPQILALLRNFLEPWGLRTIALSDPQRFWETLEASVPDLLILDVELPHLSGIELCQVVRNDPRWSSLPVLFLTAHTDPQIVHQVFAAGADDYVSKPIVGPELVTRILNRLERIQLLRNMAETDPLTGVANRRKSNQELEKFIHLAEVHKQPMCLAVLDIDRFKQVNDRYGHATGDAVLRQFGKLLIRTFRSEDVVARWGGEEFVVGMYGMTKEEGAKRLAEALDIMHRESFMVLQEAELSVTFSAGVAQYPEDGSKVEALYRAADSALYQAKNAGRDRIFVH